MLDVGGSWDMGDAATLLLMPALAAYAIAVVVALGLWVWSQRDLQSDGQAGEAQVFADVRAKEYRDLLLIALAPLPLLILAPGLLLTNPVVAIIALVVCLLISSVAFRQLLRVVSGNA